MTVATEELRKLVNDATPGPGLSAWQPTSGLRFASWHSLS